jgi:Na+/H+-dicarboxylate symporter
MPFPRGLALDQRDLHAAGVDRLLDMCRTTVNVWGDMGAARVMTRIAPD